MTDCRYYDIIVTSQRGAEEIVLWYNNPDSVEAIRKGRMETSTGTRLMRLVRTEEPTLA